jgi:Restriction endonuclease
MKQWKAYERLIAFLTLEEYDHNFTIIPNAKIKGFISERKRQIDLLIDCRFDSNLERRIIFDAKLRKKPIDIKQIEEFEGMMKDVKAQRGFIVCSNGWTKSAIKRAQNHIGIKLLLEEEIESLDFNSWDNCKNENCDNGLVLWDITPGIFINDNATVQATGKCDECGKFQIWCWGCGNRHCIDFMDEWQCSCEGTWFWLTSIENDEDENGQIYKSHYLLLVLGNGNAEIIDRRPI